MRLGAALAVAIACAAAAVQCVAYGAYGAAGVPGSIPHALSAWIGGGPARALGIAPRPAADDVSVVSADVDRLDLAGDYRGARDEERALVARLRAEGANAQVLARELWRLGRLEAEAGYREPSRRRAEWELAFADYRSALELVPLDETILLAAGNQALSNGDPGTAAGYFRRALAGDPSSAAARDGLRRAQTASKARGS